MSLKHLTIVDQELNLLKKIDREQHREFLLCSEKRDMLYNTCKYMFKIAQNERKIQKYYRIVDHDSQFICIACRYNNYFHLYSYFMQG